MRTRIPPLAPTLAVITTVVLAACSDDASPGLTDPVKAPDWPLMSVAGVTSEALHVFQAPDAQADAFFGWSAAGVGEKVLVGAQLHDVGMLTRAGQAYLFDHDGTHAHTFRAPDARANAFFGVSLAPVGENILVAAPLHTVDGVARAGQAYLFRQDGTHLRTFQAPDGQVGARFGASVAGVGEMVLIGADQHEVDGQTAGRAYLFDQNGALLQTFQAPDPQAGAFFGWSVAAVGDHVLIGARGHDVDGLTNAGQAYLFDQNGALLRTFQAPDAQAGALFGWRVAAVGENVLIGAHLHNVGGLTSAGQVYLFDQDGTLLQTFRAPDPQASAIFGFSVAEVGENVLVSAPNHNVDELTNAGQAYLFGQDGVLLRTFQAPDAQEGANFGSSVAAVGGHVLIGAHRHNVDGLTNAGQAYLFATERTPEEQIEDLLEMIDGLELQPGIDQSLSAPLEAALASLENDWPAAIQQLEAFIHQVEALRDSKLTDEEADALIAAAAAIIAALETE